MARGEYTLDMRGVEIREFINTISKMIGKTIITDSKVRGKVDIQSPVGLTKDELYEVFLVQLGLSGFSVVDTRSGILKVIPSQGAKLEGTGIQSAADALNSEQIVTRIVEVKNVNANQLAATLRPLIDPASGDHRRLRNLQCHTSHRPLFQRAPYRPNYRQSR